MGNALVAGYPQPRRLLRAILQAIGPLQERKMVYLIAGLIVFLGVHTLTTLRGPRAALIGWFSCG